MTDQIKVGRLARDFGSAAPIEVRRKDGERVSLSFPASSETPVERFFGTEVLSHKPGAVRMDRLTGGAAPLLFNHSWDDPVGMVEGARLEGGRLVVDARMFSTARGLEVLAMVEQGLRNVSIGYEIEEMTEDSKRGVYTATRWTPLEVSVVTVPADASVGVGRAGDAEPKPVRVVRAAPNQEPVAPATFAKESTVDESKNAATGTNVETRQAPRVEVVESQRDARSAAQIEQDRQKAISFYAKAARCDERQVQRWILDGTSLEKVAEEINKIHETRADVESRTFLDMPRKDVQRYSIMRALRASLNKDWTKAGLELEANKEISKRLSRLPRSETAFFVPLDKMMAERRVADVMRRDMDVAGTSGSQYLVATDNMPGSFIDLLRNTSVALRMGVRRMAGLVGNVTIPKITAGNTAYWLSDETTQITESQPTIGQLSLAPKNVAAMTELSHQLMQQSTPDAEQLVLDSIARDIALAVDVGVIRGSGASGQPQGIVGTSGVGTFTGASLATPGVLNAQADVAAANALNPGCGYVTTPTVASLLMDRPELTSTGTTPLWTGSMLEGSLKGFRAMSSNQMAAGTMLFGWWDSVILAEWGVLELMTNPYSDFTRGLSAVRGWYTCDVGMRYPAAFSYGSSIT